MRTHGMGDIFSDQPVKFAGGMELYICVRDATDESLALDHSVSCFLEDL